MLETNPFGDFNQILKYLKHNCPVTLSRFLHNLRLF